MDAPPEPPEPPEPELLTVPELARLLRVKERKVYDLAASGEVPCSRVVGKLLFPRREVQAWIERASSGPAGGAAGERPAIFLGSHDPLLEWAIRRSGCGLATFFDGSLDGLARFRAREGVAAGLHLQDAASGAWNVAAVAEGSAGDDAVLVGWAVRRRGLVARAAESGAIGSVHDLRGRRVVTRQAGSGSQSLLERLLAEAGVAPAELTAAETAPSEGDAVLAVALGRADAALGLEALALQHGLAFTPLIEERFDLLVDRRAWFEPPMQRLLGFCRTDDFARRAAGLPGYDVSGLGSVRWNA